MVTESKPSKRQQFVTTTIIDKCLKCITFFDDNDLNELRVELPAGLGSFVMQDGSQSVVKVDYFPEDQNSFKIIEPLYFCIRYYRTEGKFIYLEQTLSKPCVTSVEHGLFIYDVDPKHLAAVKILVTNTNNLETYLKELIAEADRFFHLNCFSVIPK